MICPSCQAETDERADACFTCGRALHALTQGIVLASRYEVVSLLGRGGMGTVYKAHDRVLEEPVAIKVLRSEYACEPEMERRFRSEIRLARKVSHRNVCRIHEYGEDQGIRFISMEFVDGVNLREYLSERKPTRDAAFDLALQVAWGLKAVHEHGIIHRDLKASNIMVDSRGTVRLMDFGIAKAAAADSSGTTGSGDVLGTPEYMSPEQARAGAVDFRSDIYSLGCVVFEIFTGDVPFRGETPTATVLKQMQDAPPLEGGAAASLPPPLVPVLRQALAKDPAGRFPEVREFAEALRAARAAASPQAVSPRPAVPASSEEGALRETTTLERPWTRRLPGGPSRLSLAAAVAVLAVLVGAVWVRSERGTSSARVRAGVTAAPGPAVGSTAPASRPRSARVGGKEGSTDGAVEPDAGAVTTPLSEPHAGATASPPPVSETPETRAAEGGVLKLLIVPPSEVTVDGSSLGTVSLKDITLDPGPHVVRVLHPDYEPLQRVVRIHTGATSSLVLDLAEKGIRKQR